MSASCRGFFPPKTTDMLTCRRHVADMTQTMSATLHRVGSSDAVSVSCRHDDLPTCRRRVRKKTTNITTILCNNQINNSVTVVALGDETAAWWCLERCVGWQLKVTAALGRGGSGGRWATRASMLTLCDERGGRCAGTSYLTINYLKLNAAMRTQRDGMQRNYYETRRRRPDAVMTKWEGRQDRTTMWWRATRWNTTTQQSNKQSGRGKMYVRARCNNDASRWDKMRRDKTRRDDAKWLRDERDDEERRDAAQRGDTMQKVPLIFQTNEKIHFPYCFEQTEYTRHRKWWDEQARISGSGAGEAWAAEEAMADMLPAFLEVMRDNGWIVFWHEPNSSLYLCNICYTLGMPGPRPDIRCV